MSLTLWFMGRPASGKSTLAKRVEAKLAKIGFNIENLDGDEVRKNLHPDLGFTREERALNNRRTAYVCKLLNRNGILAITAMITPFRDAQQQAREIIEEDGNFVLIYAKCSVEECERRDPKGLYEQAREGKIENFTGINHPFQEPLDPEVIVDTEHNSVDQCVDEVMSFLHEEGYLDEDLVDGYNFDLTRQEEHEIKGRLEELGYFD